MVGVVNSPYSLLLLREIEGLEDAILRIQRTMEQLISQEQASLSPLLVSLVVRGVELFSLIPQVRKELSHHPNNDKDNDIEEDVDNIIKEEEEDYEDDECEEDDLFLQTTWGLGNNTPSNEGGGNEGDGLSDSEEEDDNDDDYETTGTDSKTKANTIKKRIISPKSSNNQLTEQDYQEVPLIQRIAQLIAKQKEGKNQQTNAEKDNCNGLTCPVCKKQFTERRNMRKHLNKHVRKFRSIKITEEEELTSLQEYLESLTTPPFNCPVCIPLEFAKVEGIKKHLDRFHLEGMRNPFPNRLKPGPHLPDKYFTSNGRPAYSDCIYCKYYTDKGKRVTTPIKCNECNVRLCLYPCFKLFHTKEKLRDNRDKGSRPKKRKKTEDEELDFGQDEMEEVREDQDSLNISSDQLVSSQVTD